MPLRISLCSVRSARTWRPRATLHVVDRADHSFHVLKRSRKTDAEVLRDLARSVASWAESLI